MEWTPQRREAIRERLNEGKSRSVVAQELSKLWGMPITKSQVISQTRILRMPVLENPSTRTSVISRDFDEIRRRRNEGESWGRIAKELEYGHPRTLQSWFLARCNPAPVAPRQEPKVKLVKAIQKPRRSITVFRSDPKPPAHVVETSWDRVVVSPRSCQFPIDRVAEGKWGFCGKETFSFGPYCFGCRRLAYAEAVAAE